MATVAIKLKGTCFLESYDKSCVCVCVCVCVHMDMHSVTQLCQALCDPICHSLLGCFVHEIFPARLLEWVAISSSRGSSWPRGQTLVSGISYIGKRILYPWATGKHDKPSVLKSRGITLLANIHIAKVAVFQVVMYRYESWTIKKAEPWRTDAFELWCWRTMVLESPLDSKEIKSVNLKGNQPWIFIGRYETEAAAPIFWPTDTKSQLIGNDPDAGKYWGQEEKWVAEGEMAG